METSKAFDSTMITLFPIFGLFNYCSTFAIPMEKAAIADGFFGDIEKDFRHGKDRKIAEIIGKFPINTVLFPFLAKKFPVLVKGL